MLPMEERIQLLREAWARCRCPDKFDPDELEELIRQIRAGERP